VSVVLGIAMVAETLFLLWIGWTRFGLAANDNGLYTFSFLMLLYFAVFSVVSARERSWFWATLPSKTFMSALAADAIMGTVLTLVGLKGLMPLPWWQTLGVFAYAAVSCLVLNDTVKVAMIKWWVPNAVSVKAVDVTLQIPKAEPPPGAKAEPEPEAKGEPQPEAKAAPSPAAKAEPPPETKAMPIPEPGENTDITKLMHTTLGDVLLAGILKDPQGAGRMIAEAITHAEAPIAVAKTPEGNAEPNSETGADAKAESKAKTPSDLISKIAK
jgi:hypothetical protein